MKKFIFIFFLFSSLTSYAGFFDKKDWYWKDQYNAYLDENRPLAMSGQIKFSDYYKGVISLLESFDISSNKIWEIHTRKYEINSYKKLIPYAIQYENNQMTRAQFDVLRNQENDAEIKEFERLAKIEKECKWEATSRAGNYSSLDGDMTSNNPNKSLAAAIVGGFEIGSRQSELMRLCIDAKL